LWDASGISWEGTSIVNEVRIEKWVYGGEGLARTDAGVALVPFVLPGETAQVEPAAPPHARLVEVKSPSPERVAPPCPLFGVCGGCHYQHAPYEFQLARKAEILREQLRRVGKIPYEGHIAVVSGPPFGYRNRAQFHISSGRIGYLAAGSHDLVPVDGECPIASPRLNQALEILRRRLPDPRFPRFVRSLEVFTNEDQIQVNVLETEQPVARRFYDWCESVATIDYPTGFGTFRVSPRSFFQVNRFLVDKLVETAMPSQPGVSALDLYAGVGLFALPLTRLFASVTAVEGDRSATVDLAFNAARAGLAVDVQHARVEDFLAKLDTAPEFILADPPRAGLGKPVAAHLERLAPNRITIVSCDPATLARDLAALRSYQIDSLALVDLFPQTYHLETVAHLHRRP
jgi:23S rRNA (uracil1939-C5)-methyltransferase